MQDGIQEAAAHAVLLVVERGVSLEAALDAARRRTPSNQHPRLREVASGGCRYYHYYQWMLARILRKPPAREVYFNLVCACYQLDFMRAPDYAVVHTAVRETREKHPRAAKLVNAVLRTYLKRRAELRRQLAAESAARWAFPKWLYKKIRRAWPAEYEKICDASNAKPAFTLRVNRRRIGRDEYLQRLADAGIEATPTADASHGVTIAAPTAVDAVPGFAEGLVSVQDESAQLAADALRLAPGMRVLDACAAPGGKTGALLETCAELDALVALDLPARIGHINENLTRLKLAGECEALDASLQEFAADSARAQSFDRVLLDAPCSGSGIIRRHPDIKHRRQPRDIARFAALQLELLQSAVQLLRQGGILLYVTCSILPAENDAVVEKLLQLASEARVLRAENANLPGAPTQYGAQRLPGVHSGDGFYYCLLTTQ